MDLKECQNKVEPAHSEISSESNPKNDNDIDLNIDSKADTVNEVLQESKTKSTDKVSLSDAIQDYTVMFKFLGLFCLAFNFKTI